jgi:hypothetical protein
MIMHVLMNADVPVLEFDTTEFEFKVLSESMLPYSLQGFFSSADCSMKERLKFVDAIRNFFADRVLLLARDNAKVLLNLVAAPQRLTTQQAYELSMACRGVSMLDSFWVREQGSSLVFSDVNVRRRSLSSVVFQASMMGKHVSVQKDLLEPDVTTTGMFLKTWQRVDDKVVLMKSDKTTGFVNVEAEVKVSEILDHSNVEHVKYWKGKEQGVTVSICECMTSDEVSFVDSDCIKMWSERIGIGWRKFLKERCWTDFCKMAVVDYVLGNTDRHCQNWGFLVCTDTNEIAGMAPLFDHNQALVGDELGTGFDELIYEPTGRSMLQSAVEAFADSGISLDEALLPEKPLKRFKKVRQLVEGANAF